MNNSSNIWHPYTPGISGQELMVDHAKGSNLYLKDGRKIIDAISSWWVTTHGHSHPAIAEAIGNQAKKLEQVIFSGFTHEPAETLASRLLQLIPGSMDKVFFSDNGSTAVEVAIKLALQYHDLQGDKRPKVLALGNGYHGDTFGAMAVGGRGPFNQAFQPWLFEAEYLNPPYADTIFAEPEQDWEISLREAERILETKEVAALILEPLIQGAGGMQIYPIKWLEKVIRLANEAGTLVIADEVFTGFYRTGKAFASEYLSIKADMFCLSKGLTGGFMPLGVTTCTAQVAEPFQSADYRHTFYHGHSFTGNPLACAAANASLDLCEAPDFQDRITSLSTFQSDFVEEVRTLFPEIDARSLGTISAFTLGKGSDYTHPIRQKIYPYFLAQGMLIRPLGNVLYVLPPYCIPLEDMDLIRKTVLQFFEKYG